MYNVEAKLLLETYNTLRCFTNCYIEINNKKICTYCGCEISLLDKKEHDEYCVDKDVHELLRELKSILEY